MKLSVVILALATACTRSAETPVAPPPTADKLETAMANLKTAPSYENHIAAGLELGARGRLDEALAMYQKAADLNPKGPLAWNNICATEVQQKRFTEAIEMCEKSVALDPNFAFARNNLADAKAQLAKARAELEKEKPLLFSKLDSMPMASIVDQGLRFYSVRDLENAVHLWKRIPAGDTMYAVAQSDLASAYILLRDFASAEKAIDTALKLQPSNALFQNNKKWLEQARSAH